MRLSLQLEKAIACFEGKTERYGEKERGWCGGNDKIGRGNEMLITGGWWYITCKNMQHQ